MSIAINSVMSNYTYSYAGKLQPKLDKNDDSRWSKTEVQNYATSYEKATGSKLDVDKIMSTYAGEDGYISAENQAKIFKEDALGLSKLTEAAKDSKVTVKAEEINIKDLMESMSDTGKARFASVIRQAETHSALLDNFQSNMNSGAASMFNFMSQSNVMNLYKSTMQYNSMNFQAMGNQMLNLMI